MIVVQISIGIKPDCFCQMKSRDKKRLQQFRANLVRLRHERGLSQRGLSYLCDVEPSKISKLEVNEDSNLTLTTLFELAKGLGVHPKELIDYEFDFLGRKK
jgi:DNA-binding Xre family transcriptional regulator